ncbi:MAG: PHP domain-containing protein [Elusimicrobiota bacterium]
MFAHLHCHTVASFSDSTLYIKDAVKKAALDGQKGMAITDHGVLSLPFKLIEECKKYDIIPAVGCEFYFVNDALKTIKNSDNRRYHLVLMAKNKEGMSNLINLINVSWKKYNFKDRRGLIDWRLLKKYNKGLVALSGCYWNIIARTAVNEGYDEADKVFGKFKDIFGSDFYCEVGRHGVKTEEKANKLLEKLASRHKVKIILTNDSHYLDSDDSLAHDCYIKSRFYQLSDFSYDGRGFHFRTEEEMKNLGFPDRYLNNTVEVLEKCRASRDMLPVGGVVPKNLTRENFKKFIDRGQAAYVPKIVKVEKKRARWICQKMNCSGQVSKKLTGLWREITPNTRKIAISSKPDLEKITPLMYNNRKRFCQFPERELLKQNVTVLGLSANG